MQIHLERGLSLTNTTTNNNLWTRSVNAGAKWHSAPGPQAIYTGHVTNESWIYFEKKILTGQFQANDIAHTWNCDFTGPLPTGCHDDQTTGYWVHYSSIYWNTPNIGQTDTKLEATAAHEIGHALGLFHNDEWYTKLLPNGDNNPDRHSLMETAQAHGHLSPRGDDVGYYLSCLHPGTDYAGGVRCVYGYKGRS